MTAVRVAAAVAEVLATEGTRALFSVPASETMAMVVAAERLGIATYHARHEQAAVGMADGYGRFSGRPGVVVVGRGPGFTNGLNALVTAVKAGSPVLVVTGELPRAFQGPRAEEHVFASKNVDQAGMATSVGCAVVRVTAPERACAEARQALHLASTGHPTVLLVPTDVAAAELPATGTAPGDAGGAPTTAPATTAPPAPCDPDELAAVADLLCESWACQRPLLLAGRGASSADAREALVALGDRIGAVLVTTLRAKDLFTGEPADGGILGTLSSSTTSGLAVRSDLALVFGASLHPFTTYGGDLLAKARVVQFDEDPGAFGRNLAPELSVRGDAATAARALVAALDERHHRETGYRQPAVLEALADARRARRSTPSGGGRLEAPAVLAALDAALPADRTVVVDAGAHMPFAATHLSVGRPDRFCTTAIDYTSVGSAFGVAMGAAVAEPAAVTVLVIGDGGLAMALPDLQTLARYRLPVAVVVLDDEAFGQEVQLLALAGLPDDIARYPALDFEALARSVGIAGATVRTPADLAGAVAMVGEPAVAMVGAPSGAADLPVVLDCKVPTGTLGEHSALVSRIGR